eukprot:gb/GEZN01006493.1/.p1 GENE.gb/GEZN01006493.1/~~gb/GEZN01006493.1/.p1  ORF type:complete len:384 (+),score=59.62 gb/GEZN01006493.1/:111-1262(+)
MLSEGEDGVALELKRQRHNESEKKRRQKVRDVFMELATLVNCKRTQQSAILRMAIERVLILQETAEQLRAQNEQLAKLPKRTESPSVSSSHPEVFGSPHPELMGPRPPLSSPLSFVGPHTSVPSAASPSHSPFNGVASSLAAFGASRSASVPSSPQLPFHSLSLSAFPKSQSVSSPSSQSVSSPSSPMTPSSRASRTISAGSGYVPYCGSPGSSSPSSALSPALVNPVMASSLEQSRNSGPMSHGEIFLCSAIPMFASDLSGRILDVNPAFVTMLGSNRDALLAQHSTLFHLTHPDHFATSFAVIGDMLGAQKQTHTMRRRFLRTDGSTSDVKQTSWICLDQMKQPAVVMSICAPDFSQDAPEQQLASLAPPAIMKVEEFLDN